MTVNVVMSGLTLRVLVNKQIPDGLLQGPP